MTTPNDKIRDEDGANRMPQLQREFNAEEVKAYLELTPNRNEKPLSSYSGVPLSAFPGMSRRDIVSVLRAIEDGEWFRPINQSKDQED